MATVADFPVHGFDVSSYQPAAPDFRAGGRAFAIFKATEGTGYFDSHFAANRRAAHEQGCVAVGMYHFARPSSHSADAEADWFLRHVGSPQPGEFAVLDYEVGGWNQAWISRWGQLVRAAGWKTVLYTYAGMLGPFDRGIFDLWIAAYGRTAPGMAWRFWQHTDGQASVGGNDGGWDCSVFRGSVDDLRAWVGAPRPVSTPRRPRFIEEENGMAQLIVPPGTRGGFLSAEGKESDVVLAALGGEGAHGHLWMEREDASVALDVPVDLVNVKKAGYKVPATVSIVIFENSKDSAHEVVMRGRNLD